MQLLNLSFPEQKLYCPFSGQQIVGEDGLNENATTLAGMWLADTFGEPTLKDRRLQAAWNAFVARLAETEGEGEPEHEDLERFLRDYDAIDYVAFKLEDPGPAFAADFTAWLVLRFPRDE